MESLHNDGLEGRANGKGNSSGGGRRLGPSGIFLRLLACGLLCGVMIWFGAVQAQTTAPGAASAGKIGVINVRQAIARYFPPDERLALYALLGVPVPSEEEALKDARPASENGFKVELAKRCIVRALTTSTATA